MTWILTLMLCAGPDTKSCSSVVIGAYVSKEECNKAIDRAAATHGDKIKFGICVQRY